MGTNDRLGSKRNFGRRYRILAPVEFYPDNVAALAIRGTLCGFCDAILSHALRAIYAGDRRFSPSTFIFAR
jgi:hypothetical protein